MHTRRRPSVIFVNRFYWPDVAATGQLLTDLAEDLAASGWDVRVITGRAPYGEGAERIVLPVREEHRGVVIERVSGTRFGRERLLGRAADYISYALGAAVRLLACPHADVIVGLTDPPLIMAMALLVARLRASYAVHWAQDIFPDIAVRLGVLREASVGHRVLRRLARFVFRRVDLTVALGEEMRASLVSNGAPMQRVVVISNWADTEMLHSVARDVNPFLTHHDLRDKFVVMYSGNAGRVHTFHALNNAMLLLRDDADVVFVFVGGGNRMHEIRDFVKLHGLYNARFLDYVARPQLSESLSAADVSVVTEAPSVTGLVVPSKAYGILASGRPILFIGSERSDIARLIRDTKTGFIVAADDPSAVAAAIRLLRDDSVRRLDLGRRARHVAVRRYSRRVAAAAWESALTNVLRPETRASDFDKLAKATTRRG